MKKNELYQKAKESEWKTYKRIQAYVLGFGLLSFLINWRIGLVGCLWFIWNDIMFELGNREHEPQEYVEGYLPRGLKKMFLSWPLFIIGACLMLWLMFKTQFLS